MAHPYMRRSASRLARAGRHGDSMLVHMSPDEVMALMSMGDLSINPKTGLPEAFKLGKAIKKIAGNKVLGRIANVASIFPSPIQPFAMAYSAANALANKRPLMAVPYALGAAGFSPTQGMAGGDWFGGPNVGSAFSDLTNGGLENVFNDPNVFRVPDADLGAGAFDAFDANGLPTQSALPGYTGEAVPDPNSFSFADANMGGGGDIYNDFGSNGNMGPMATGDPSASSGPIVPGNTGTGRNPFEEVWGRIQKNPMTAISGVAAIGSGIYGMYRANQMRQLADRAWGPVNDLSRNPGMIANLPGYQFGLDQGRLAIQRRAAAQGGGGNEDIALARFTPEYARNFYNMEMANRMTTAAGRGGQNIAATGAANNLDSASLASMGYGITRMGGNPQLDRNAQLLYLAQLMNQRRG